MRSAFASIFCLALCVGCSSNVGSSTKSTSDVKSDDAGAKKLRIAVIPKGTTHVFWNSVHAGAEKAAKELGNVTVLWKGPLLENDRDGQLNVVQDFVSSKVDGICLAPLDKQALIGPVNDSVEAGIPVAIFDSALQDESKIVSYVATDNRKGGELAAKRMSEALNGQGNVILLRYQQGSESTELREEGFLDELKANHPGIKVLSSNEFAGHTPEMSFDKATQMLGKYRDSVNGIFAVCEPNATGVMMALKETQLAGKVKFIAFDPNEDLIRALQDKTCDGIILQDPVKMGYEGVMTLVKSIRGEKVEKRVSTGEYVATPENMKTPEIDRLLNPERF